jgi:hypothetical protein
VAVAETTAPIQVHSTGLFSKVVTMPEIIGTSKSISGFDPRSIPGCQVWLDGSDPAATGVVPADGASVSSWVDKSGNGYNFTASSAAVYNKGSNGIAFTNNLYSSSYPANPTTETIFIISTPTQVTTGQALISGFTGSRAVWVGYTGGSGNLSAGVAQTGIAWLALTGSGVVLNNTRNMTTVIINGGRSYIAVNGDLSPTALSGGVIGGATFTAGTVTYLGREGGASFGYYGYVNEIIIYNTYLTPQQRESVQGYLFWRWDATKGQTANRSDSNARDKPFFTTPPFTRPFNPIDIPGCQLWLDAADQSYMTLSGSSVTQWNDKSGNARNYTTLGTAPIYSSGDGGSVTFSNGQALANTSTWSGNGAGVDIFAVSTPWPFTQYNNWRTLFRGSNAGHRVIIEYNSSRLGYYGPAAFQQFGSLTLGQTKSLLYVKTDTSFVTSAALNGTVALSVAGSTQDSDAYPFYCLGAWQGGPSQPWGTINEVMVFSNLTTNQRQYIEGYLAHKWNLVTDLPATHPFKKFPSSAVLPFSPTNIPRCILWLDGADFVYAIRDTVGAAVTTWYDKSLMYNNATPGVAGSVIVTSNGLSFNGTTSYMTLSGGSNMQIYNTPFVLFVVETLGNSGFYFGDDSVNNGGTADSSLHVGYRTQTNHTFAFYSDDLENYTVSGSGVRRIWTHWLPAGSNRVTRRNGAVDVTHVNANRLAFLTNPRIGRVFGGSYYQGTISEIIIYRTDIGLQNVQAVEGYLAWKWQVNTSLPTSHPYYEFPSSQLLSGISGPIGGVLLFLDPQTYVSGASTWVASTGNTWNVYNSPTVSKLNEYNILTFNGTNQYCFDPTGVNFQSAFSINIWIQLSAPATQGNILQETNGGYQWTDLYVTGSTLYVGTFQISNVSLGTATTAWTNICFTNSASGTSTLVTYVNGVRYSSQSYTRTSPGANSFFYITGSSGNANYGYKAFSLGVMSFHNVALLPTEVLYNYNAFCTRYSLPYV